MMQEGTTAPTTKPDVGGRVGGRMTGTLQSLLPSEYQCYKSQDTERLVLNLADGLMDDGI